jgi:hypothetical protein
MTSNIVVADDLDAVAPGIAEVEKMSVYRSYRINDDNRSIIRSGTQTLSGNGRARAT